MKPVSLEQKKEEVSLLVVGGITVFFPDNDSSTSCLLVLSAFSTLQLLPEQDLPGSFGRYEV